MTRKMLMEELAKLSAAERILVAQDLWDSVAEDPEAFELSADQKRELDRRLAAYEARRASGEHAGSEWSEVKQRVRKK